MAMLFVAHDSFMWGQGHFRTSRGSQVHHACSALYFHLADPRSNLGASCSSVRETRVPLAVNIRSTSDDSGLILGTAMAESTRLYIPLVCSIIIGSLDRIAY